MGIEIVMLPSKTTGGLIKLFNLRPNGEVVVPFGRRNEASIQAKRQDEAKALGVEVGKDRPGVIDTGHHAIDNRELCLNGLLESLVQAGFHLEDIHWEEVEDKKRPGRKKPVTVIAVTRQAPANPPSDELIRWAASQLDATYQYVHVWVNPKADGSYNFTVNCNHRQPACAGDEQLAMSINK